MTTGCVCAPANILLLNSTDRVNGTTISDAVIRTIPIQNVCRCRLENFALLNAAFAIQSGSTFLVSEGGPAVAVSLPAGTPDLFTFAAEVQTALNAAGLAGTFTVTASATTLSLTISSTVAFSISWPASGSASPYLGWGTSPSPTGSALTHTSPGACALLNPNKVLITISFGSAVIGRAWASCSAGATFIVDVSSAFGELFAYRPLLPDENLVPIPQRGEFSSVRVQLVDAASGLPYDTRLAEWQLQLALW